MDMKELSLVVPIYNEEAILEKEVERMFLEMEKNFSDLDYEIFLVENGSFDRTKSIAEKMVDKFPKVRTIHLPEAGYGKALKEGLLQNNSKYTVLFNIDFWDVPFVKKALDLLYKENLDMIVGSKTAPGAEDTRPFLRRSITKTFNWLLQKAFDFSGTDTHGMKLIVTEKIKPIIKECKTEKEIFDTEFVLRAQHAGLKTQEVPVVCEERRKTTYNISKRIPRTIKDLVVLFFSLRLAKLGKIKLLAWLAVISTFLIAVFWGFPDSPSPWFDNGVNLGLAKTYVEDGVYSLRLSQDQYIESRPLFISTNYPLIGFVILSFKLFGVGLWQAQIIMILFLLGFLWASAKLIKETYGTKFVLPMLALVVTFLPFYGNGLSGGLGEVPGLFYLLLALIFFKKEKNWQIFLAGLFFGLAASTKVFYLVILGALGFSEIIRAIYYKKLFIKRWLYLAFGAALPLLVWLRTLLPEGFVSQDLQQIWQYYSNPYNVGTEEKIALSNFILDSTLLHFTILTFFFSIFIILQTKNKKIKQVEVLLFIFVLFNIKFFLGTSGWFRYLFPAHLVLLLFFPISIFTVLSAYHKRNLLKFGTYIVLALVLVQSIHLIAQRDNKLYYNPIPRELAQEISSSHFDKSIFVVDKPELWFLLKGQDISQRMQMNPYIAFGEDIFATGNLPDYIISGEPTANQYLNNNATKLEMYYNRSDQKGSYVIFEKK